MHYPLPIVIQRPGRDNSAGPKPACPVGRDPLNLKTNESDTTS